ncbi:MAG TPA: hypothetical protein VFE50_20630 [Cyclobacteriaceae bacterium]|nr:hypothetical protein [Cyclobacteriaceae bacterium]
MKPITLLSVVLFIATTALAQTTRIVNNNAGATGGVNVYTGATALQTAINASVSGDIIQIVPGTVSNGNVTITDKSLTLLGVGLNPQKGIGTRSLVGDITLLGAASSGFRISGVHFLRFLPGVSGATHTISNILIENCEFGCIQQLNNGNGIGNVIVRNCVMNSHQGFSSGPQAFEIFLSSGVLITNNIIRGQANNAGTVLGDGLTIQNNLFYGAGSQYIFTNLDNSVVDNNIFIKVSGAVGQNATNTGNTFRNNIVFGSTDNTFTNGVNGNSSTGHIIADPLLTNVQSTITDWIYTNDITLLPGSPAINAGLDGTNLGPTGGTTPFDTEGTLLPLIQSINMPAVVTKGTNLQVNVKAKGN